MVKRRHKPISDSEIITIVDHNSQQKVGPSQRLQLVGTDPQIYLTDVINKIVNGHPNSRIDELLPWAYAGDNPLKHVA